MRQRNFLITGGAGFIGSHLVDRLVQIGKVTIYDNLSSGKMEFISHNLKNGKATLVEADLLDLDKLTNCMKSHDVVFHLAANPEARAGLENTRLDLEQETVATYNVLEAMRSNGIKQILFSSSGTVYGDTPVIPLKESYGPVLPISLYGAGKLACEGLTSAFCHIFEMQGWIFRFANIVGGRGTHGVIFDFVHKLKKNPKELEILGDGKQEKPYLLVDELIDGMLLAYKNAKEDLNLFSLGTETSVSVNEIADIVVEEMGLKNVEYKYTGGSRGFPGDVPQIRFDTTKINQLGWRAKYTSAQAVRIAAQRIIQEIG